MNCCSQGVGGLVSGTGLVLAVVMMVVVVVYGSSRHNLDLVSEELF